MSFTIALADGAELEMEPADLMSHAELFVQLAVERVRDEEGASVARVSHVDRRGVHVVFLGDYSAALGGRAVCQRMVELDADLDAGGKVDAIHELLSSDAPCPSCGKTIGTGARWEEPEPDVGIPGGWHGCETCIPYARRAAERAQLDLDTESIVFSREVA